jgi:hypothetical protein
MASTLPSLIELGQLNAALIRAARLDADCSPTGGTNSGWSSIGLATATATPDIEEGAVVRPKNANGVSFYTFSNDDVINGYNLTGEFIVFDVEGMELLFGGEVILGAAGGDFAGDSIGYASPGVTSTPNNGVYLEIITQQVARGAGDCVTVGSAFAPYVGHIFPKARLTLGERTFEEDAARLAWTAKVAANPSLYNGPWNDWPGAGYIPAYSPYIQIGYTSAQYEVILAAAANAGYKTLPAGS